MTTLEKVGIGVAVWFFLLGGNKHGGGGGGLAGLLGGRGARANPAGNPGVAPGQGTAPAPGASPNPSGDNAGVQFGLGLLQQGARYGAGYANQAANGAGQGYGPDDVGTNTLDPNGNPYSGATQYGPDDVGTGGITDGSASSPYQSGYDLSDPSQAAFLDANPSIDVGF